MALARLAGRFFIGGAFAAHGTQKLFGWFGGGGPEGTGQAFESLGLRPGKRNALAAGATETLGGAGIALGAFTPLAAAGLIGTMATAVRTVHLPKGFFVTDGGYEYNVALIAALLILVDGGPGPISIDRARGREQTGAGTAFAALAAGLAGSAAVIAAGRRGAPEPN